MKLEDVVQREPQHVCIFGESGSGKSTLAMTAAEAGFKLLWFSFDGGHSIFKKLPRQWWKNVEVVSVPNTADNPLAIVTILAVLKGRPCKICDAHGILECRTCVKDSGSFTNIDLGHVPSDTIVVFDHLSAVSDSATNWVLARRSANVADEWKKAEQKMEWDDWRLQGTLMDKVLTNIQNARFNCIAIAQMRETKMDDGKRKIVPDIGTGNYSKSTGQYFDHVVFCDLMNKKHVQGSSTTFSMNAVAKSRTDVEIEGKHAKEGIAAFFNPANTIAVSDAATKVVLTSVQQTVAKMAVEEAAQQIVGAAPEQVGTPENLDAEVAALEASLGAEPPATPQETVATKVETPVNPAVVSGAERAKALLAAMRGKK